MIQVVHELMIPCIASQAFTQFDDSFFASFTLLCVIVSSAQNEIRSNCAFLGFGQNVRFLVLSYIMT